MPDRKPEPITERPSLSGDHHPHDVIAFVRTKQARSIGCALLIITDIEGGTLRSKGAMMGVSEDGDICGYISNGCVDSDIVLQAKDSLGDGKIRRIHYGEGSPYLDITLSCGGYIKVLIVPNPSPRAIETIHQKFQDRAPLYIIYAQNGTISCARQPEKKPPNNDRQFYYPPKIKLIIAGRGAVAQRLAVLARSSGFETVLYSPDKGLTHWADPLGISVFHLFHPQTPPSLSIDPWTATALMFHDHDWEQALLVPILEADGFYIGALGSYKTHQARCDALAANGISKDNIARIIGPIGSVPAQRDANLIALSTLAQILEQAHAKARL